MHHRNQGCVQTQQGNSSTCASCSSVQAASDPTWGTSPNMLPRLLHSQGLSKNSAAWPTRVSNQNMVMCSCNAPFPQGLHPRGGEAGDSWWKLQISHIPPPAPRVPPPKGHKSPLHSPHKQNLHWRKVSFLSSASTLLLHCGASFFPSLFFSLSGSLSSPPPLRLPIAPQPSSATKLRDHVQRRQAAPAVFQVSPPTMLRSATHRNTV